MVPEYKYRVIARRLAAVAIRNPCLALPLGELAFAKQMTERAIHQSKIQVFLTAPFTQGSLKTLNLARRGAPVCAPEMAQKTGMAQNHPG